MMSCMVLLTVTLMLPGPTLIPTDDDLCPVGATLTEYTETARLYTCTAADGSVLWHKIWCGVIPKAPATIAAEACFSGAQVPSQLTAFPHFHCETATFTWRVHCLDLAGHLRWDVSLHPQGSP